MDLLPKIFTSRHFYIMMGTWAICFYKENGKHLIEEFIRMIGNLRLHEHFK